ncbi:hypothetical protein MPTK1_2g17480 [Marchantia polymorpha subsp. ruderalis]|uniref:Uncharacterized protein n=1 Tax=Marchantia polymorpha TaxID=3197 RepID=A0A2R6WG61_MARPO|nr:hypothetical protein MARPO_0094s0016 [Marchantia polymorpha]BBN02712.1 hypothetical protein Mp_2g17480 [Marchantia polymorpha subsp. ruderalis]|eukprot:PTQ32837.1 hypothetical protein MARPO_0094s0016 [Marchantia polymorpha]
MTMTLREVEEADSTLKDGGTVCQEGGQLQAQIHEEDRTHDLHAFTAKPPSDLVSERRLDYDALPCSPVHMEASSVSLEHFDEDIVEDPCEQQDLMNTESNQAQELQISNELPPSYHGTACSDSISSLAVNEENAVSHLSDGLVPSIQKDQRISQLEAELLEIRQSVDRVQSDRLEVEKAKELAESKVLHMQVELEVAKSAARDLQAEREDQKLRLNQALEKLEVQSRFLESGSFEANRANECIDLERNCHDLKMRLLEKESALRSLKDAHDQLRGSHKRKEDKLQQEREEVINALEASELKCEEQSARLRELENDLSRFKVQTANMEKRCSKAESKASESSSMVSELQSKLDSTVMELFELKNSSSQVDSMRMRLKDCESALSHEKSQRASAEKALKELKHREEHLEEVEQQQKELNGRLKWRNEQFQSLEEAHSKLRTDFRVRKTEWDSERSGMLSEIDTLQGTLDSKERLLQQVQNQLQMVHQALAHEESRRKVLEIQAAEARQGLEQATADCEAAQSSIESLRQQTSTEIGSLRDTLGAKDRQLKDLQVTFLHMEQEFRELKTMEKEYRDWLSTHGEQQKQMADMKEKMSHLVEAHDSLRARVKEQEKGFEKERKEMVKALDLANDDLTAKDQAVKQLDGELERLKGALEHVKVQRSELDVQLKQTREQLEGACVEAGNSRLALASLEKSSHTEKAMMLESLNGKDKIIQELKAQVSLLNQTIAELNAHEEKWWEMHNECQSLRQLLTERDAERREMDRIHESLTLRRNEQEKLWLAEREKLVTDLQLFEKSASDKDQQLVEAHHTVERHREVISKLESRCASVVKEIEEHSLQAQTATELLALEKLEMEKLKKEAKNQTESLSAALSHKEITLQKLTDDIKELETELGQKATELSVQNERVALLEKRVKETTDLHCNMEEHISAMKAQAAKDAEELKILEDARKSLEEELRRSQEEHLAMKAEIERKLEIVQRELSTSSMRLKAVTQQLEEESAQKELLLKDLDQKESTLAKLTEEKKSLIVEKDAMHQAVQILEAKKHELVQEVESSRISINKLCNKVESIEASLASRCTEVKELQAKIQNAHKVDSQLRHAEEKIKELEGYLKAAKAIAQDKEEKLAASEWAVQQLALDVTKAKNAFHVKEREEAILRENLDDLERQLRGKEGELIEMECYLEEAAASRKSMEQEVELLNQRMEDLDRGAAEWKRKESDMTSQLEIVGTALEEKREALVASEMEVKQGNDLRQVMEGAIESLKSQLADEQRALSARQLDMNRLCEDLERTKEAASLSAELVKDLQGRLQQLEQSSEDRLTKFQSTVCELQEELSAAHTQLEKYEVQTNALQEESSRYKEKCESLLDLHGRKDCTLKDMEAQLDTVQSGLEKQGNLLERRERELRLAKEQLLLQDERQTSMQESVSRLQGQAAELQSSNEELQATVRKLTSRLDNANVVSALKSEEIDSLKAQVEHLRAIAVQEGESQALVVKLSEDLQASSQGVLDRDARIRVLSASLEEAQGRLQVVEGVLASKEIDVEMLQENLSLAETKAEDSQTELTKLQEELKLAQSELAEKSQVLSSYVSMMNVLEVEAAEWKERADTFIREEKSLKHELQTTTTRALETEQMALDTKISLEQAQLELKEKTDVITQHLASVTALQEELNDWKEKALNASQEQQASQAALALAEVRVVDLQEILRKGEEDASKFASTVSDLQAELLELRLKETAVSQDGSRLRQELDLSQAKSEQNQQQISELQKTLEMSEQDVKEKTEKLSYYVSLSSNMEESLCEWKQKAAAAEAEVTELRRKLETAEGQGKEYSQEVLEMKEAIERREEALREERKNGLLLAEMEKDLIEGRRKVSESYSLLAGLQAVAEDWKRKAEAAAEEGEGVQLELAEAMKTLNELTVQVEGHQLKEQSLTEQNNRLQLQLAAAEEEVLARKMKMQSFLGQLEQSQKSERDLLVQLRKEHKMLSQDLETEGSGFECTFDIHATLGSSQAPADALLPPAWKRITSTRENGEFRKFAFNESQDSADDCTLVAANEALEKELVILRLQSEESQQEAHKLAVRLDAALSNLATKNLIIKQVHDEISGLRAVVKALELEKLKIQDEIVSKKPIQNGGVEEDMTSTVTAKPTTQEELTHYLELCDSLVRKNIRLEKQLDGLQRKNRGLQKQVEGLQIFDKNAGDKQRKSLDRFLITTNPETESQSFPRKVNAKSGVLERKGSFQDMSKGKVLGELDENACPVNVDKLPLQMSRRPPFSPAAVQQKKARMNGDLWFLKSQPRR